MMIMFYKVINLIKNQKNLVISSCYLLVAVTMFLSPIKAKRFGDLDFHIETKAVVSYLWGDSSFSEISVTRAPGPILFYAIPYFLAGPNPDDSTIYYISILWTNIIHLILVIVIMDSLKYSGSPKTWIITFLLLMVVPLQIYYSLGILAESCAFTGVCLLIYGHIEYSQKKLRYNILIYSLGLVLLFLSRPTSLLTIPILIIWLILYNKFYQNKIVADYFIAIIISIIIVLLATFVVIKIKNNRETLKQQQYLTYVMHHGRFQFRTEIFDWRFWDNENRSNSQDYIDWKRSKEKITHKYKSSKSNDSKAKFYLKWILKDIVDIPGITLKQFFVRILYGNTLQFSSVEVNNPIIYWGMHIILNIINLIIIVPAYYLLVKNYRRLLPISAPVFALLFFHGLIYMEQRYLFPVRLILIYISSSFWASVFMKNVKYDFIFIK